MASLAEKLRDCARGLLAEGKADVVIGHAAGTLPMRSAPCFVRSAGEVEGLIFDHTCGANLAKYLVKDKPRGKKGEAAKPEKVALIAKGCDGRAAVQLVVEGQIARENVIIIGVPCRGVIDPHRLGEAVGGREVLSCRPEGESLFVGGDGFKEKVELREVLSECCLSCRHPVPPVHDVLVEEAVEAPGGADEFAAVEKLAAGSPDERWAFFEREFFKCIRCYACRNACPMCFCGECFIDQNDPQWFGKSTDPGDTMLFHAVRVMHTAGRCVDCGACVRACPVGVDIRALAKRAEKEVRERFGCEAGVSLEEAPALAAFDEDDPQEFIL